MNQNNRIQFGLFSQKFKSALISLENFSLSPHGFQAMSHSGQVVCRAGTTAIQKTPFALQQSLKLFSCFMKKVSKIVEDFHCSENHNYHAIENTQSIEQ